MKIRLATSTLALILVLGGVAPVRAQELGKDDIQKAIAEARERVYPALVNISVITRVYQGGRPARYAGAGSGVIVSPDGIVLTNYHVAGGTVRIRCTLPDRETIDADVVTHDPLTDISVLKLRLASRKDSSKPLPFARLGDSDAVRVGQYCLAMGNPRSLSSSVTLGVVANTKRVFTSFTGSSLDQMELETGEVTGLFTQWIQHDALIQPGNSGGPLVNLAGEVIGINELGGTGMGFAIPSNLASTVLAQALANGEVIRGWVGVSVFPVGKLGLEQGVLVASVIPKSPADVAGIQPGDVMLKIGEDPIHVQHFEEVPTFYRRIAGLRPGTVQDFTIRRGPDTNVFSVAVKRMEKFLGPEAAIASWGATVRDITGPMALARRLESTNGVLITGIRTGKPLADAKPRLGRGDVILAVGGDPVTDLATFEKLVEKHDGEETLVLRVRRRDQDILTAIDVSPKKDSAAGRELPKAWIGVRTQVLTKEVAEGLGLGKTHGFRITEVFRGTEAAKAGVKVGDIVTEIDGAKLRASRIQDAELWRRKIERLTIDTNAELTILRGDEKLTIDVLLEETPTSSTESKNKQDEDFEFGVREIAFMDRISRRWSDDVKGVIVTTVVNGGWASIAGLSAGDLILKIHDVDVTDLDSFEKALEAAKKARPDVVRVLVRRGYRTVFVFIEPDWGRVAK